MQRSRRTVLTIALAATATACGSAQEQHVRFLTTHDLHGALVPRVFGWSDGRPVGGVAVLKTLMDAAAAECDCVTFRLDGGDQMQGTLASNLTHGASAVEAFNLLNLDAAAVGNHELDWGADTLRIRQSEAGYPWLAANVRVRATGERPDWAPPYAIVERGGVKLGVIGLATSTTGRMLTTSMSAPYLFQDGMTGIRDALTEVRAEDADFIVIVAHAAGDCNGGCRGEMVRLAESLDSGVVDLIVGGHRHTPGSGVVNGIPILRAGSSGRAIGVVDVFRDANGDKRFTVRVDTAFADVIEPDAEMVTAMEPHLARADSLARRPIVTTAHRMGRRGREYGLGRMVADAIRAAVGADVGLSNRGGIRADLPEGTVTYGDLYLVKPFGNTVYRFELTGARLLAVIEHGIRGGAPEFFSGIRIRYDPAAAPGSRVESLQLLDGRRVEPEGRYTLASSSFLGDGGGGFAMLEALEPQRRGGTVLDALVAHLRSLPQPVSAPSDPRAIPINAN